MSSHRFRIRSVFVVLGVALFLVLLGLPGENNSGMSALAAPPSEEVAIAPSAEISVGEAALRTPADRAAAATLAPAVAVPDVPFRPTMDPEAYQAAKAAADNAPKSVRPGAGAPERSAAGPQLVEDVAAPLAPPTLKARNFDGVNQIVAGNLKPPDTHGAVGPSNFVEVTNSHIDVYTKGSPPVLQTSTSLAAFFGYGVTTIFDPNLVYDPVWKRWVVSAEAFPEADGTQRQFLAISTTVNPNGAYYVYHICCVDFGGTGFWDYPHLGYDQDAVFVTANFFFNAGGGDARMLAVAKALLYNGRAFSVPVFTGLAQTLMPPIVHEYDQGKEAYFVAANNLTHLHLYRGEDLSNAFEGSLVFQALVDVPDYGLPPSASQPGTTAKLDTLDARFQSASMQYGDSLWNVHTIDLAGFPTPRFYQIDTEGAGANTVKQQGFFFKSGTSNDFNPSITANHLGEAFVTWTATDPPVGTQAQVRFSGRQPADPPGLIPAGSALFTSPTFYTGWRWGDYSAVTLDPVAYGGCAAGRRAWLVNEKINGANVWGSRIGRIGFC